MLKWSDKTRRDMGLSQESFTELKNDVVEIMMDLSPVIDGMGPVDTSMFWRPEANRTTQFFTIKLSIELSKESKLFNCKIRSFHKMTKSEYIDTCIKELGEAPPDLVNFNIN